MSSVEIQALRSSKGGEMFEVSEKARKMVKEFFKNRGEPSPIRIILSGRG